MTITTGMELSRGLRELAQDVRRRLWIASPFVGSWFATKCLLDNRWQRKLGVKVRLLTDVENKGWLNPTTIRKIAGRGEIKHLRGLHAKIYIIDDMALVSSANLTRTAFERRYEFGVFLSDIDAAAIIGIFEQWWNKADSLPREWFERLGAATQGQVAKNQSEEPCGTGLKRLYSLPQSPESDAGEGMRNAVTSTGRKLHLRSPSLAEFRALFKETNHLFVCNTNRSHDREAEPRMRDRGYAAAWEKFSYPAHMKYVEPGNGVLFYANGHGVIGIGCAKSRHEILPPGNFGRLRNLGVKVPEWRVPLDWLVWADDGGAFPWRVRTVTFQKVNDKKYPDLRNEIRRHFQSFAGTD